MAVEIEMKAWVRDEVDLLRSLDHHCSFQYEYEKKDVYLHGPLGKPEDSWAHWRNTSKADSTSSIVPGNVGSLSRAQDFRLRMENGTCTCTFKDRSLMDGMEVNREEEFEVSDSRAFLELAARLGCRVYTCKVKRGRRYRFPGPPPLTVEYSTIEGLGVFLEVECVISHSSDAERHRADAAIRQFFVLLKIDSRDIEDTPYSRMLADRGVNQCDEIAELSHVRFEQEIRKE